MDILVFAIGSLAVIVCSWFALQVFVKLLLGLVKLGLLAGLAFVAAHITWINAEVPTVSSPDVKQLLDLAQNQWNAIRMPAVQVRFDNEPTQETGAQTTAFEDFGFDSVAKKERRQARRYF